MALIDHVEERLVVVRGKWISPDKLESIVGISQIHDVHATAGRIVFEFDQDAGLMAGAGLRLLSLLNQLADLGAKVHLRFASKEKLYGYLNRNGFFDLLDSRVSSEPELPRFSSAILNRGQASGLVEIARLDPRLTGEARYDAVTPLVDGLVKLYPDTPQSKRLHNAAYLTLTELIDNVYSHSESPISGFAILQAYTQRSAVQIAVSDSGIGIPESIRRALGSRVIARRDEDLIVEAFERGLSRHGSKLGRSCGLPRCAQLAAQFGSKVQVRTPSADVTLQPKANAEGHLEARIVRPNSSLAGTHICLDFPLDEDEEQV